MSLSILPELHLVSQRLITDRFAKRVSCLFNLKDAQTHLQTASNVILHSAFVTHF